MRLLDSGWGHSNPMREAPDGVIDEEIGMNPNVRTFKSVATQVCSRNRFPLQEFLDEWGLEEILTEANEQNSTATQIAASVLWTCCCTDGKFNKFQVGFLSVLQYLKEREKDIGMQPYHDLAEMMKAGTTNAAIEKWMETHFP